MPGAALPAWQRLLREAWLRRGWLAWLLWPLSALFGLLVRLRQGLYLSGLLRQERAAVPVIVVGNVVVGGAGKTPLVIALVRHLQTRGRHPGVISRGHGRHAQDCREVLHDGNARETGDEPLLIRQATGVPVFVAAQRIDAARALMAQHPEVDVLIADDGLQHLGLARDIEICVFDERGTGNGLLLPAGPLREPWPRPVDLVVHTAESRPAFAGFGARRALATHARRADGSRLALADLAQPGAKPLLALAAIARPEAFFAMLRARGIFPARTLALPDHFDFAHWQAPRESDCVLLCTEKDAVKLWAIHPQAWAVPLELTVEPAFFVAFDQLLSQATDARLSSPHGHPTA